jgi:hypothetical protein
MRGVTELLLVARGLRLFHLLLTTITHARAKTCG